MTTQVDRFWPPSTLTDEERQRAKEAFERTPSLLEDAMLAALGHCERGETIAAQMLERVRCSE